LRGFPHSWVGPPYRTPAPSSHHRCGVAA